MVQRIDKELLRKRAEHNDGDLSTLKEVTLHQYDIEKIENLDLYCRHLEILFLQNNQISKIENLHKLKELKYLQLALNNISKIENLDKCESLEKLDLTVNFVEDPLDVEHLKNNEQLRELYLLGNPCARKEGYRELVITILPQLKVLDGREITRTERLEAAQQYGEIRARFLRDQERQQHADPQQGAGEPVKAEGLESSISKEGEQQKSTNPEAKGDGAQSCGGSTEPRGLVGGENETSEEDLEEQRRRYQTEPVPHTASARLSAARDLARLKNPPAPTPPPTLAPPVLTSTTDGRILQKNQGKWSFHFTSTSSTVTLHVSLSKHLSTSLIDVHVEPTYIRILVKNKILQLVLDSPVSTDNVICERSTVSGWLAVTMLKADVDVEAGGDVEEVRRRERRVREDEERERRKIREKEKRFGVGEKEGRRVGPREAVDVRNIVAENAREKVEKRKGIVDRNYSVAPPEVPANFHDDPDVPPLC
ncbi:hypothetical protein PhCBS80983_g02629 [Powellomyces hirtus]|uniref:Dynein axonemal assembly factor 11-like CS domain-containing protein n=1 Tax=Powellomyces hirtus TaxID=109895 RepID=A0A507E5P9_9FUNG|nr:hypothetical protein PhCBS80983_g02629 [Powellomyces hirtus]